MWSDLESLIEQAGLEQAAELIRSLVRPAIRLTGGDRQSGSHLGGLPLLPASIPWPLDPDGAPLACLAQINLAEVAYSDVEQRLPADGLLTVTDTHELNCALNSRLLAPPRRCTGSDASRFGSA